MDDSFIISMYSLKVRGPRKGTSQRVAPAVFTLFTLHVVLDMLIVA